MKHPKKQQRCVLAMLLLFAACSKPSSSSIFAMDEPTIQCADEPTIRAAFWRELGRHPELWRGPVAKATQAQVMCSTETEVAGALTFDKAAFPRLGQTTLELAIEGHTDHAQTLVALIRVWESAARVGQQGSASAAHGEALAHLDRLGLDDVQDDAAAAWLLQWIVEANSPSDFGHDAKPLLRWLEHAQPEVRAAALDAFGLVGGPADVPDLLRVLQAERRVSPVRIYEALANLGGREATDYLEVAAQSEIDPQARLAAKEALARAQALATANPSLTSPLTHTGELP